MTSTPLNLADGSDNGDEVLRQRKRGAELEDAIRAATVAELACAGYDGVTIESIATRAQTGKASIYRRWATKQELVADSLNALLNGPLLEAAQLDVDETTTTRDVLLILVRQVAELMGGRGGSAMRSIMSESLRDSQFCNTFLCDFFEPRKQALVALLERGVRRGEVRSAARSTLIPQMLAGTLMHRILVCGEPMSEPELIEFVDEFIMRAIA